MPDEAGNDEGQGEGIKKYRAEGVFKPDFLVHQRRQHEADDEAEDQRQHAVYREILDGHDPARRGPQPLILVKTDEACPRQKLGIGE
ncbi:hypothetical protein D3C72_1938050 [compost metagenome]